MSSLLPTLALSKTITRLIATWKGKGALKKSALKRGNNADKRIENSYNIKDLIEDSNMLEEIVVELP
jgi:hypothetical protein